MWGKEGTLTLLCKRGKRQGTLTSEAKAEVKAGDTHFGVTGGCRGKVFRCMGQRPLSLSAVGSTLLMRCLIEVGVPLCAGCLYKNNKWKGGFR